MILLVDNDISDVDSVREALYRNNFIGEIAFVSNGKTLIDLLHKMLHQRAIYGEPELILLELSVPYRNGFNSLREIKNHPDLKDIPVIIYSSSSDRNDEMKCFTLGCNLYFKKPNTVKEYDELVNIIINYLKTSEMVKAF